LVLLVAAATLTTAWSFPWSDGAQGRPADYQCKDMYQPQPYYDSPWIKATAAIICGNPVLPHIHIWESIYMDGGSGHQDHRDCYAVIQCWITIGLRYPGGCHLWQAFAGGYADHGGGRRDTYPTSEAPKLYYRCAKRGQH
jgi:hypothetical protein